MWSSNIIYSLKYYFSLCILLSSLFSQVGLAIVTKSVGDVEYKYYLDTDFNSSIKPGTQLFNNDLIRTGSDGFVKFSYLDDGTTIKVHKDTEIYIGGQINKQNISKRINMSNGILKLDVSKQNEDEFKIITPTSVASVKGTSFILETSDEGDRFYGFEGVVEILNKESNQIVSLSKNLKVLSSPDGNINSEIITNNDTELLDSFIIFEEEAELDQDSIEEINNIESTKELRIKVYNSDGSEKIIIIKYNE